MTSLYDDDDWYDDRDLSPAREEPDYACWTCEDSGIVQGAKREVTCPHCRPTPRQQRRQHLVDAWWARRHERRFERDVAAGILDDWAPF